MRILLLSDCLQNFHSSYYYLIQEMAKTEEIGCYSDFAAWRKLLPIDFDSDLLRKANLKLGDSWFKLSRKGKAKKRVRKIMQAVQEFDPDAVLVMMNDFFAQLNFGDCSFVTCPKAYLIADVHLAHRQHIHCIKKSRFDLVLFVYKWWENRVRKQVGAKTGWLPHSVNTNVFRDYRLPKLYDAVSAGHSFPDHYPLRHLIQKTLPNVSGLKFSMPTHPQLNMNQQKLQSDASKFLVRENYAKFLNQSKMLVFGSSIHNYPVAKYVEGMGSETLVLAQFPKDGKELGFVPNENFVEINGDNFVDKIKWYLKHDEERQRIVDCARETVLRDHSTEKRAQQLTDFLREL
jgi:spore maturation protein CgeB